MPESPEFLCVNPLKVFSGNTPELQLQFHLYVHLNESDEEFY